MSSGVIAHRKLLFIKTGIKSNAYNLGSRTAWIRVKRQNILYLNVTTSAQSQSRWTGAENCTKRSSSQCVFEKSSWKNSEACLSLIFQKHWYPPRQFQKINARQTNQSVQFSNASKVPLFSRKLQVCSKNVSCEIPEPSLPARKLPPG